ncbi:MAG: DUF2461 domain-containing protein [Janthinobacterium lividum]
MIVAQTFDFLKDLVENNHRDWFLENKVKYEQARENVIDFAGDVLKLLAQFDPAIKSDLDPKKCVMRIYRDVRFSKDKTPYKNNFGVNFKTGYANADLGYYVHLQPDHSFVGGGYWMPPTEHLKAIRQEIDYNGNILNGIINDASFMHDFSKFDKQEQLKNNPKGYETDHEFINLLKLKSFAATHSLPDTELMNKNAAQNMADYLLKILPLNNFLNQALH